MKHSPSSILAEFLTTASGSLLSKPSEKVAWPVYISFMPDGGNVPADCAAIYDTPGIKDGRLMKTGETIKHHGLQLRIRSTDYEAGWKMAEDIAAELDTVRNARVTMPGDSGVGDTEYKLQNVSRASSTVPLGKEPGTDRYLFTANFLLTIKQV